MLARLGSRLKVTRSTGSIHANHALRIIPQTQNIWPPPQSHLPSTRQFRQQSSFRDQIPGFDGGPKQKHEDASQQDASQQNASQSQSLFSKAIESAITTLASVLVLGVGFGAAGYFYHKFYKHLQLRKMENAFAPGDPVLELAAFGKEIPSPPMPKHWVQREEQVRMDNIIDGSEKGHYYLIMGDKGCGKSSMLLEAMRKIDGEGCAMFEAHSDLELFRTRLGKALDYEFHEDYIGGYFSERGPRETTALLDIERALNKLEKVALRQRGKKKKPLVLIINQMQLLRDDEDGRDLLELLQQRAEQWAAANLVTMIFNTDDYWIFERFKQLATRMEVIPVGDLQKPQALYALQRYRYRYYKENIDQETLEEIYDRVGGRLSFLNRVAKTPDMLATCDTIKEIEKTWFLNQCWIFGSEMDDDVMDQQKWAVSFTISVLKDQTTLLTFHSLLRWYWPRHL